ncbi:MAG TPA: hypothetical protein VKA86_14590 [Candidatus Krumholzibacteria bacterium]|nr:hypothetical protein [Candidatus Krumholzibacteria bacterium]
MKSLRILLVLGLVVGGLGLSACGDDDDNGGTNPNPTPETPPWVGSWVSEGDNVAPILAAGFDIERVEVTMNEDGTIGLVQKVVGQPETTNSGVYSVIESDTGDIHAIQISYTGNPSFDQEGIIQVIEGDPDTMRLEVVQTVPDIGATPLTPEEGFGADTTLGDSNIQVYVRQDEQDDPAPESEPWEGSWLSEGENVAPILAAGFDIERVEVTMNEDGTIGLVQKVIGQPETTNSGVYSVTESATGDIHSIQISYTGNPSFEQEGIIQVIQGDPDTMRLEVVQTVPDIGATPLTPEQGFGADTTLGDSNIQVYVRQ